MILRAIAIWLVLMVLAILNGALREAKLVPALGTAKAHVASTLLLCLLIVGTTLLTIRWIGPASDRDAILVGGLWLAMTLAFEFGFGHWVAGKSWSELLADYNLAAGRIWILVLVTTVVSPWLANWVRGTR